MDSPVRVRLARIEQTTDGVLEAPLRFQSGPLDSLPVTQEGVHEEYETVRSGQFSRRAGGRQLRRSEGWETILLDWEASWADPDADDPERIKTELRACAELGGPFSLLVTHGDDVEINMRVTLRRNDRDFRAGEADTRYLQLDFVEWRPNEVRRKGSRKTGAKGSRRKRPGRHKLKPKDTLFSLAKDQYGTHKGWRDIAEANGLRSWGPNDPIVDSKKFAKGDTVKLPRRG